MLQIFKNIKLDIFGESHSEQIGMTLDGIKAGTEISIDKIQAFVDRRKPTDNAWSTHRHETDKVEFVSGVENGLATGDTIRAIIKNTNQRSTDYDNLKNMPRPSHADYVAAVKFKGQANLSGGGRFSGRMTAPLCIAGAIASNILESKGIEIGAYISEIGGIKAKTYKNENISLNEIRIAQADYSLPVLNAEAKTEIEKAIISARNSGDSLGGIIECIIYGLPVGLGNALFDGLEGRISASIFAIPAIKAIEFGSGFDLADMCGSKANDAFFYENGRVITKTNHNGGINGGISNGMEVTFRVGIKPTPSIAIEQQTVDLSTMQNTTIKIKGRHDACIVPRAVPCVEAAAALAVLDALLEYEMENKNYGH